MLKALDGAKNPEKKIKIKIFWFMNPSKPVLDNIPKKSYEFGF